MWADPSKATHGCRVTFWQVSARFCEGRQEAADRLLNVKGSQVQIRSARPTFAQVSAPHVTSGRADRTGV